MATIFTSKKLPERAELDFYPTPKELCSSALDLFDKDLYPQTILDPGAGYGVWGDSAKSKWPHSIIVGVDIDEKKRPINETYSFYFHEDFLKYKDLFFKEYDLIIGNPPYIVGQEFVEKSYELLKSGGYLLFLLRLTVLESRKRYSFWKKYNPKEIWVCCRRPSFTGNRKTSADAYLLAIWQKGFTGKTILDWLDWNYESNTDS